jgi:hypothetical protein
MHGARLEDTMPEKAVDVREQLLDAISKAVKENRSDRAVEFAEAYAWLVSTDQPHGGHTRSG